MALTGGDSKPHGQFLDHVEHRNEEQHQRQQAIAPLRAALGGGDDIAGVRVGQHDEEAGSPDRSRANERAGADGVRRRFAFIARLPAISRRPPGRRAKAATPAPTRAKRRLTRAATIGRG
jgi:hypothetical protein